MKLNEAQLVIHDVPLGLWLFGAAFAGIGVLIVLEGGPPLLIALVFVAVGLGLILFSSALKITADRATRTMKLEYRSLLLRRLKEVPFDDVAGINVERTTGGRRGTTYRLTLLRKDGQVVPFRSSSSSGWKKKEHWAVQLREFIGIQDSNCTPPGMLPPELSQAGKVHETDGIHWQIQPMFAYSANAPTGARWHSPDFEAKGAFLFVAQKAEGQSSGGFLALLGKKFIKQALLLHGFQPEEMPGLEQAGFLSPLDPALEPHFMAYTSSPESARQLLNWKTVAQLAGWAARYPMKQLQSGSRYCQLMTLFGPNGVYLATMHLLQPSQAHELISLGVELVKAQKR